MPSQLGAKANSYFYGTISVTDTLAKPTPLLISGTGGLVGQGRNFSINSCFADANISGRKFTGGLVGNIFSGSVLIQESYFRGAVDGSDSVGGLVGRNTNTLTINNSYAHGNLDSSYPTHDGGARQFVGGLVGNMASNLTVDSTYYKGNISGVSGLGVLAGTKSSGTLGLTNSYFTDEGLLPLIGGTVYNASDFIADSSLQDPINGVPLLFPVGSTIWSLLLSGGTPLYPILTWQCSTLMPPLSCSP